MNSKSKKRLNPILNFYRPLGEKSNKRASDQVLAAYKKLLFEKRKGRNHLKALEKKFFSE